MEKEEAILSGYKKAINDDDDVILVLHNQIV